MHPLAVTAFAPIEWFVQPFADSVTMQRALVVGSFVAVACGLVGTWVVLRSMTFLGDALAHGVLPGLALATVLGFNLTVGAVLSAGVMIAGITVVGRRARLTEDTAIGLLFVGMLAIGVLIISRSRSFAGDLTTFLFGGITSVTDQDVVIAAIVAVLTLVAVAVGYRAFLTLCFNPGTARLMGMRPGITHAVLMAMVTATVVASFSTVGTLLVFALITAPAAAAVQVVRRVPVVLVTSVVLAEVSVVSGLLIAWHARLAAGAAMATSAVAIFVIALLVAEVRALLASRRVGSAAAT
jgi:zinc/manganese transport system permease protein